jgi:hypothetical protein
MQMIADRPQKLAPTSSFTDETGSAIGRITGYVLRHRKAVILFWLAVFIAGGTGAGQVSKRLSFDFSLPGQPRWHHNER